MLAEDLQRIFDSFSGLRIGVVGDAMLDTYMWGEVERISPEAPVPIVTMQKKEYRIGGAGNVALNLRSLGVVPFVISVTGNDGEGELLRELLVSSGISTDYLIRSEERITTNKTRIISRNQQMMRLDSEITNDLSKEDAEGLIRAFERFVKEQRPHAVILEDYNKGVLTERCIGAIIEICKRENIITAVDPKRKNFFTYKGVDIFKPNLKEIRDALNLIVRDINFEQLQSIHSQLNHLLNHRLSLITLSEKGVFYAEGEEAAVIPSHLRNIADVSGAGDTVIAVATVIYASTKNLFLTAEIANIAGGLVCEEVGTAAIDRERLLHECEMLLV